MDQMGTLIIESMEKVSLKFMGFLPNLIAAVVIMAIGILLAWVVRLGLRTILRLVKFDTWSDRAGLTAVMRKGELWSRPTDVFASLVFWIVVLMTMMAALSALRLVAIDSLIQASFLYLPRAFSAIFILVVGYIIAGFVSQTVLITAVNSGYRYARLLAEAVRLLLTVLILAMALEQLQVAPGIVIAAFSIIFGGIVLALAISFGVGGIDAAKRMIEKEKESGDDLNHM